MKVVTPAGETVEIGQTETGATVGIIDYSRRVTDDFGVTTIVPRDFAKRMSVRLGVEAQYVDALQQRLASLRATSAMWIADSRYQSLQVQGFFKDFDIDLAVGPLSYCTLTVEGLTAADTIADDGRDPAPVGAASTLMLVTPTVITDAQLVADNVPETDQPAWAGGVSYGKGARVIRVATHRVYESLIAANVGHTPETSPSAWIDIGPTNRWAMFDQALGTVTTNTGSIVVTLSAGTANAVALVDVVGDTVDVQVGSYHRTQAVVAGTIAFLDLPSSSAQVSVIISGSGVVSVGTLLIGTRAMLGITEASPTAGITDYSRKVVDDFGQVAIVQRAWAKRMTAKALIAADALDVVAHRLTMVRSRPVLWIGQSGSDSLTIYGFVKEWSIEQAETVGKVSLSIEGLSTAPPVSANPLALLDTQVDDLKVGVVEAGKTAEWPKVVDTIGTKPADNATVGATVGKDVKAPDGSLLAPPDILNSALALSPNGVLSFVRNGVATPLGRVTLPDLGAASDSARRQLEADLSSLSAAVAQLAAGQTIVQNVFRDAGLYTDAASGITKLFAIEKRAEQITNLSVTLNAALGSIGLKADVNYVDQAILKAQLTGQTADLNSIFVRLTSAEANISGLQASVQLKADATVVTGLQGTVSSVQQTLDALAATVSTKASQTIVDAQGVRLSLAEQTLSALDGASIAQAVTASRRAPGDGDALGATTILDLLNSHNANQLAQTGIAAARTELGARVTGAFDAIASLTVQLGVQIGGVTALVGQATTSQIAGDQALATQIATYQASTNGNLASINQTLVAQTTALSALSGRVDAYDASLGALSARITEEHSAWTAGDQANATALATYRAQNDQTVATATQQIGAVSTNLNALSQTVTGLSTTLNGHTATLTTYGQSIDGLRLRYGVEFNDNGVISGFSLNGGGGRTDALFLVSNFKIARANGGSVTTVFSIGDDGVVEMPNVRVTNLAADTVTAKQIVLGAVGTGEIAGGAVTNGLTRTTQVNQVSFGAGMNSDPFNFTTTGGSLQISVCVNSVRIATGAGALQVQLFRSDGAAMTPVYKRPAIEDAPPVSFFVTDAPPAGQVSYYVAYTVAQANGAATYNVTSEYMIITELKR